MKKVPGNSSTAARSNRRLWLWFAMVFVMALASFLNFFESFKSFQFATSSSSAQSSGDIESIETQGLQMYPFGIQHYQKAIHHLVQDEYDDEKVELAKWTPNKGSKDECLYARDYGLLQRLRNSSRSFCTDSSSPYTFYHVARARLSATMLEDFVLDVRGAEIAKDIESLADDGSGHDPRFTYMKNATFCRCTEPQDHAHGAPNIWKDFFVGGPGGNDPNCKTDIGEKSIDDKLTLQRAVVLTIGWERNTTQLVTFDRALPTPVDELRHSLLGPERPIIGGEMFQNRVVHFESALLVPYEVTGPLMSHLDDNQPCYDNDMIKDFRDLSLKSLGVTPRSAKTDPKRCLVTVISRRPYGGRRVQRLWRNEDEILRRMREEYQDAYRYGECEFQSLEFTNMTMHDQMKAMLDSDVVIGMHGAGMVNVLWTRPETLVIEIFPRRRFRWGYRNICQYIGCKWHDFRRGRDIGIHSSDPNDMDKFIPYPEWKSFFDSLFRYVVDNLEQKVGEL
ncbi:hypothetical protein PC129_g18539 [Phytophthora cactorum]|uniref:Glycosyltransferase 61 catalytic domain-containing protein n=1 Tax=Phytophthora cactorum TaxID=29920 RepID=A0A8T1HG01_9STRA|nr:hypothetical protein Pcac1_g26759 [Phytophthora cactorum]KAG3210462.1 hypothetical protein PC129_g18539 [Phytophthora cactorum]